MVVFFHAGSVVRSGYLGVDVFFVISGFVITGMLLRELDETGRVNIWAFYARRAKRLLPALVLMLTCVVVLSTALQAPFRPQRDTAMTAAAAAVSGANFEIFKFTGGYFDASARSNPLLHTWSLSVEEQFYLVLPGLLAGLWFLQRKRRQTASADSRKLAIAVLAMVGVASGASFLLITYTLTFRRHWDFAFYASLTRAWEFVAGAVLALAVPTLIALTRRRSRIWSNGLALCAAIVLAWAAFGRERFVVSGRDLLIPVVGTVCALAAGAIGPTWLGRTLAWRPLVWVGDRSYSIYLWHWPFVVFAAALWGSRPGIAWAAVVLSLGPAVASYRFVEQPFRRLSARPRQVARLAAVCVGVPLIASTGLFVGARASWGNDTVRALADRKGAWETPISGCTMSGYYDYSCDHVLPEAKGTMFLVGDSHAMALSEAATIAGQSLVLNVRVRARAGCAFVRFPPGTENQLDDCRAWVEGVLREIEASKPQIVMIHQCARVWSGCPTSDQAWLPIWQAGLASVIASVAPHTGTIILVHDVPSFDNDLDTCFNLIKVPRDCGRQRTEEVRTRLGAVSAAEDNTVQGVPRVVVIDPVPVVCEAILCRQVVSGQAMYRDGDHLSVVGADRLVPLLRQAVGEALAEQP